MEAEAIPSPAPAPAAPPGFPAPVQASATPAAPHLPPPVTPTPPLVAVDTSPPALQFPLHLLSTRWPVAHGAAVSDSVTIPTDAGPRSSMVALAHGDSASVWVISIPTRAEEARLRAEEEAAAESKGLAAASVGIAVVTRAFLLSRSTAPARANGQEAGSRKPYRRGLSGAIRHVVTVGQVAAGACAAALGLHAVRSLPGGRALRWGLQRAGRAIGALGRGPTRTSSEAANDASDGLREEPSPRPAVVRLYWEIKSHSSRILSLASHPTDPLLLATSSMDYTVRLWDLEARTQIAAVWDRERPVRGLYFHPDHARIILVHATAGAPGEEGAKRHGSLVARLWNIYDLDPEALDARQGGEAESGSEPGSADAAASEPEDAARAALASGTSWESTMALEHDYDRSARLPVPVSQLVARFPRYNDDGQWDPAAPHTVDLVAMNETGGIVLGYGGLLHGPNQVEQVPGSDPGAGPSSSTPPSAAHEAAASASSSVTQGQAAAAQTAAPGRPAGPASASTSASDSHPSEQTGATVVVEGQVEGSSSAAASAHLSQRRPLVFMKARTCHGSIWARTVASVAPPTDRRGGVFALNRSWSLLAVAHGARVTVMRLPALPTSSNMGAEDRAHRASLNLTGGEGLHTAPVTALTFHPGYYLSQASEGHGAGGSSQPPPGRATPVPGAAAAQPPARTARISRLAPDLLVSGTAAGEVVVWQVDVRGAALGLLRRYKYNGAVTSLQFLLGRPSLLIVGLEGRPGRAPVALVQRLPIAIDAEDSQDD